MNIHTRKTVADEDKSIWHEMTLTYDEEDKSDASLTIRGNVETVAISLLMHLRATQDAEETVSCGNQVMKQGVYTVLKNAGKLIEDGTSDG